MVRGSSRIGHAEVYLERQARVPKSRLRIGVQLGRPITEALTVVWENRRPLDRGARALANTPRV